MPPGARLCSTLLVCAAALATAACNLHNQGDDPPPNLLYFPNSMTISPPIGDDPPRYLFVGNCDFDLRYRSGTVQAYSLEKLATKVDQCRNKATACELDDPADYIATEMRIAPFVTAIGLSSDARYLFASTRTERSLSFMHVDITANGDAVLQCPYDDNARCGLRANGGHDPTGEDGKRDPLPNDPEALYAGPLSDWMSTPTDAEYVLVAQQQGIASLFVLQPDKKDSDPGKLWNTGLLTGFTAGLTQINYDPTSKFLYLTLAATAPNKVIERIGIGVPDDANGAPDLQHALPYPAGYIQLDGVAEFSDTRDIAFIPGTAEIGGVAASDRALIVSESPSALLVADLNQDAVTPNHARVLSSAIVGRGATRVVYGDFDGHPFAVVGSFGSRELAAIDLTTMQVRAIVPNLSGPFALAMDERRKLLYAADFRSSVIRVVDLAPLFDPNAPEAAVRVVVTLGKPRVLQELQ